MSAQVKVRAEVEVTASSLVSLAAIRKVLSLVRRTSHRARAAAATFRARYHVIANGGDEVSDILVRDVPDDVVAARAARLGLSRSEYLRRRFAQEAMASPEPVTVEHLAAFAETFADLGDARVMKGAWE